MQSIEAISKRSILFKVKKGENFNSMNILHISRIKFESGTEIGGNGAF